MSLSIFNIYFKQILTLISLKAEVAILEQLMRYSLTDKMKFVFTKKKTTII